MSVSPVLDDLDRALLARLGSDARTPVSALATTLGVARGTVRRFTVELDPTVDEQAVRAITLVQVSGATARAVAKAVRGIPEVRALHSTNGKWDMVAELHCGSLAELDQALQLHPQLVNLLQQDMHDRAPLAQSRAQLARLMAG